MLDRFNLAYNRRPDIYVNAHVAEQLGLDPRADFAVSTTMGRPPEAEISM